MSLVRSLTRPRHANNQAMPEPAENAPSRVTRLLASASQGDRSATEELFPLVYEELRVIAERFLGRERPGQTLQPTALVHEAYLRMVGPSDRGWENRAHFFGAASQAIRRILTDRARNRSRVKRGGSVRAISLQDAGDITGPERDTELLALDEALSALAALDPQKARVVELRFFGGLTGEETAEALGISASTVARDWRFARVWLHARVSDGGSP